METLQWKMEHGKKYLGNWKNENWKYFFDRYGDFYLHFFMEISDTILIENEDINLIFGVARVASGLPGLPVTGCLCIALQQSTADPARGSMKYKKRLSKYTLTFFSFAPFDP